MFINPDGSETETVDCDDCGKTVEVDVALRCDTCGEMFCGSRCFQKHEEFSIGCVEATTA